MSKKTSCNSRHKKCLRKIAQNASRWFFNIFVLSSLSFILIAIVAAFNGNAVQSAKWDICCLFCAIIYAILFFICPISRDRLLASERFYKIFIIAGFILSIPFGISGILQSNKSTEILRHSRVLAEFLPISPIELVTEDNAVYEPLPDSLAKKDSTIEGRLDYFRASNPSKWDHQQDPSIEWSVFYHFLDPGNQHMTSSKAGRYIALLIALLGSVLMTGLLISTFVNYFDRRIDGWEKGTSRYKRLALTYFGLKNYYVIIGANKLSIVIIQHIVKKSLLNRIVVLTSSDIESFRNSLKSKLTEGEERQVVIYSGHRKDCEELKSLCLKAAKEIYILGEDGEVPAQDVSEGCEPYHDTINMKCYEIVKDIRSRMACKKSAPCYVLFEYQTTFSAFQSSSLSREIKTTDGKQYLEFIPFSSHEIWAQKVIVKGENIPICEDEYGKERVTYRNIDGEGISYESDKTVHLIIVGMSKMGTAMAIEAAHVAHFPNFVRDSSKRTKITFIDKNAKEESEFFRGRFAELFNLSKWTGVDKEEHNVDGPDKIEYKYLKDNYKKNFIDIEWEFRTGGIESDDNRRYLEDCVNTTNEIVTIAICLPWPHQSIAAALYLPTIVVRKAHDIWVYQPQSGDLLRSINPMCSESADSKSIPEWKEVVYSKLKPFGMLDQGFDEILLDNKAALYCNNFYNVKDTLVNKYKRKDNKYWSEWTIDAVESEASKLEESYGKLWMVWSNIYQINMIEYKLRSLPNKDMALLNLDKIKELFAVVEHNRWNVEKLLMGYKPMSDIALNEAEAESARQFLTKRGKDTKEEIDRLKAGIKEKDVYYKVNYDDISKSDFNFKQIKNFYKDGPMRIHPNITPFEWLPIEDKDYDVCFTLALPFLKRKLDGIDPTKNTNV